MKHTVFKSRHEELGARMVPFAEYLMPVQYKGINIEHEAVRNKLGVFDVSHMGKIWVEGTKAFDLVQRITSNDVAAVEDKKVQYTCMPNGKGGIIDDFLLYKFNSEKFLLVVNASNIEKDYNWINQHNNNINAAIKNDSDNMSILAIQGPKALECMQKLTNEPIKDLPFNSIKVLDLAGIEDVIISITGYTGAGGCEIYFKNEKGPKIWDAVMKAGKEYGIEPAGLAARDTLRIEMGLCLYGNDIDDTTSPLEAGLGWITKFTEGNNFVNREALQKQKEEGVKRKLVGFEAIEKGIPRQDYPIVDKDGREIGIVTSGTMSPTLKKPIGMGYVKTGYHKPGTEIFINIRKKSIKAKIVKRPFLKQ